MIVKFLWICGVALAAAGCGQAVMPVPTEADVARTTPAWPDASLHALEEGRRLYMGRCGSCHRPFHPAEHAADTWNREISEMRGRARLDDRETELIRRYLETFAKPPTPNIGAQP